MPHPLLKIICLAVNALGYYVSLTPPIVALKREDERYRRTFFNNAARHLALVHKTIACTMLLSEIVITAVAYSDSALSSKVFKTLCHRERIPSAPQLQHINVAFAVGTSLMVLATIVRIWCYRTLGQMFTFELTIRPDHILVTTGPYAYARHPSYTAAMMNMLAFLLVYFAHGSWEKECRVSTSTPWRLAMGTYVADVVYSAWCLWRRGPVEDARLRAHFGREWEEYRARVPWAYLPYIH